MARFESRYRRFAAATSLMTAGDGVVAAAVPLLAATLTRDPRLVSVVAAAASLPWLLFSLPAGALVDRHDRAGLLWRGVAVQAVLAGVVAALAATGRLGVAGLAALAFGLGTCQVVAGTAAQALLPSLVAPQRLPSANGYQQTIAVAGQQFLGPPAGSLLFVVAAGLPFGADATVLAVAAALLATLRQTPRDVVPARSSSLRSEMAAGLRWLAAHRLLRTLTLLAAVNTFCFQLGTATLVLLATTELGVSARGFGLLLATAAIGSLAGGVAGPWLLRRLGDRTVLLGSLTLNAVAVGLIGLSPSAVVLGALLAATGLGVTLWNLVSIGLRQRLVPAGLLGRVMGVHRLVGWGFIPFGALLSGVVAHTFGLRAPYPLAGAIRVVALLAALPALVAAFRGGDGS
ncbi:MFS transporter [Jiangella rhizosphaerae]|uniref:MFS transporter n=1 Tax=Jiangella rhizosphaerae TaxID=2293569 RepID=A0A418KI55_9ACTN|nr:MFS transporter [Jiangella rhizosphaerae]RIQ12038.1 MFS transporter [Jiangella rhizosphaerae]